MENTEQIWQDYHAKLFGFIRVRVGDSTVADDILQEVFLKIYAKIDTLKESSKIQSWIYQITRNAIIDHYRTHKKLQGLPESLSMPEKDSTDQARQEMSRCLRPMINSLPDHIRETVILSEIEGLKQKEVAVKQELSVPGVKKRIQRGRSMMKEIMLKCCQFEFDHQGKMIEYDSKDSCCDRC